MILDKLDFRKEWGAIVNQIQDIVCRIFDDDELEIYLKRSAADLRSTEGMDGILFNFHYFDWREFDTKKKEIVAAYLEYFTDEQLERIDRALKENK